MAAEPRVHFQAIGLKHRVILSTIIKRRQCGKIQSVILAYKF